MLIEFPQITRKRRDNGENIRTKNYSSLDGKVEVDVGSKGDLR